MKDLQNKYYFLAFFLFGVLPAFAEDPPPAPPAPTPTPPPPPPGLVIDENIFVLLSIAILFGIYIIYKSNIKSKSPI